ncbi:MAG: cobalamin-dependent protein [Bacteroidota bacterium]|nr:cobalamin-dependent protein [Bacteroidota bacterium]
MKLTISSKKAANYFNVNESTIKRWADSGILKCYKTAGGHRKFKLEDLRKHAIANDYQNTNLLFVEKKTRMKSEIIKKDYTVINNKLEKYILKGNIRLTYELLFTLYMNKYSLDEIFDCIIKETMKSIGLKWENKTLSIESEHIATNTIISSLHQFENIIQKKVNNKKTAICAGLENEFHEIGLLCVKIALEEEGWNVIYPGINLPVKSLTELIKKHKSKLLCVSSTFTSNSKSYKHQIKELKKVSELSGAKFLFGGENKFTKINKDANCISIWDLKKYIKEA